MNFLAQRFLQKYPIKYILKLELYQHVKIFPEVLRHEAEEGQEGPAEAVKAGVAVVWIPPSFHTRVALRAAAGVFYLERQSRRDSQQGEKRRRKQGTGPGMTQQLFTCHAKLTSGKREEPTARSWWDQRRFTGGTEQLTQSLSCSRTGARPAGQAGSRNWLRRDSHGESSRILSQPCSCIGSGEHPPPLPAYQPDHHTCPSSCTCVLALHVWFRQLLLPVRAKKWHCFAYDRLTGGGAVHANPQRRVGLHRDAPANGSALTGAANT